MKREKMFTGYCLVLTVKEYLSITDHESHRDDAYSNYLRYPEDGLQWNEEKYGDNGIHTLINDVEGILKVEYNGHFGPNIFYDVEHIHDTPAIHKKVKEIIQNELTHVANWIKHNPNESKT